MFTVDGNVVHLVRGDTFKAKVDIKTAEGEEYTPASRDSVRFALKKSSKDSKPKILKGIPNDTLILQLEPSDTKPLAFGLYYYDIEITLADGTVDTFIPWSEFYIEKEAH